MRHHSTGVCCGRGLFQFTHPRGVRRAKPSAPFIGLRFNSRTREGCDKQNRLAAMRARHVSIHAPARGATAGTSASGTSRPGFNSRTREGCDANSRQHQRTAFCFNSRTREGCDAQNSPKNFWKSTFQFTHPRGVRRRGVFDGGRNRSFNSRTREGCDVIGVRFQARGRCFNSRTREGCDLIGDTI